MNLVVADGLQLHTISLPARSAWASVNVKLEAAIGRNVALRIPRPFQPFASPVGQVIDDDHAALAGATSNCYIVSHAHWRDFQVTSFASVYHYSPNILKSVLLIEELCRMSCPLRCNPKCPRFQSALLQHQCLLPSRLQLT
jgi:hypothetical protein